MRKINAAISLITTALLLEHAIFLAVRMLSQGEIPRQPAVLSWTLAFAVWAHATISLAIAFASHKKARRAAVKGYAKLNRQTLVQRISGVLMLVLVPLHVAGTTGLMNPPKIIHAVSPILFFTVALAHVAVSASKAFITLGIGNARFIKATDLIVKIICALTFAAALTGFYLFGV